MPASTGSDVRTASQATGGRAVFVPPDGPSYRHDLRHPRPAGRGGIVFRCAEPPGVPACSYHSNVQTGPEIQVTVRQSQAQVLSRAVELGLPASSGEDRQSVVQGKSGRVTDEPRGARDLENQKKSQ